MRRVRYIAVLLLCGCSLPKDPDGTLQRVQGGTLRVGVAIAPPWTMDSAGTFGGIEPALVRTLARELGTTVKWVPGNESVLLPLLRQRKLDLVIAGLDGQTPWKKTVGITRSYHTVSDPVERRLVWAVAPGENAWQVRVEHFLRGQRPNIDGLKSHLDSAQTQ
jgi:polar amino acid transport system substrate-binding protein